MRVRFTNFWFWIIDIDACFKILIIEKFRIVVTKTDSSRLLKWCFSIATSLISFLKVTIRKLTIRDRRILFNTQSAGFCIKIRPYQNRKVFCWPVSIFNLKIFSNHKPNFFHQNLNRILETFGKIFKEKWIRSDPCLSVLIVRRIQMC